MYSTENTSSCSCPTSSNRRANWRGEVTAYRNNFRRDWFKLQSVAGTGISSILEDPDTFATEYDYITGSDSPDDAIVSRHNNREYYSQGIQANVSWELQFGDTDLMLRTGVRLHEDEEDRLQSEDGYRMEGGQLVLTSIGAPGSQSQSRQQREARFRVRRYRIPYGQLDSDTWPAL